MLKHVFSYSGFSVSDIIKEVHILAYFYHWGERDILALSRKKRHEYIKLIKEQVEAENGGDK